MAIPRGFEPLTHSLEGCCSIQLSYGTLIKYHKPQRMVGTIGLLKLLLRNFAFGKPAIPPYCLFLVVEPTPVGSHPIVKPPIISQRMVGTIGLLKLLLRNFASGKPAIPPYCLFLVVEPTPVGSHPIVKLPIISQRMVGTIGFEPTASCSQSKRSTRLS